MDAKQIPLNDVHITLGAKMAPFAGFNMPVRYISDIEEHMTVREGVGVFDVSHMGEFFISGTKALELIQKVSSNDASKLVAGQAQYSCLPNDRGGIVDDLIVYRFHEEEYMLVVNASNIDKDWEWIAGHNEMKAKMKNVSYDYCLFAVQGPKANEVLQRLTPVDLSTVPFYHFRIGAFADHDDVVISNTGYTGSGGFEIYVKNEAAHDVWDKIIEAGRPENIRPVGLGARDTLRLEKGYCLYGNDIDDTTSPLEAGLGWITKFTKDFINSTALLKQKEEGVSRRLVGFAMIDRGIPRHGYELQNEAGDVIGHVTSGSQSPVLKIGIGMGYVEKIYAQVDTEIYIVVRNRSLRAKVVKMPFV